MSTVILDAGHGGFDNGATYMGRREKDDALKLTLAVGQKLIDRGINVNYTRTTDVYQRPIDKANLANSLGGDLFVSIHRNSSETPNVFNGVQTLIFNGGDIKETYANNINQALENVGFANLGIDIRPNLVVLKRTQMPALLVETGFLNSDRDNQIFDWSFDAVATAIADGIANSLAMS
ncbi:MAG: N-acetylmuramoyl-L-alanine amidase [Lachnospiraceae bacterium]|nr:N-acetylmuramoyl-L-alanine amidase [Lachnospiraceae bacterium]